MDWRDSDLSEEETHTHSRKRSSRGMLLALVTLLHLLTFCSMRSVPKNEKQMRAFGERQYSM